MLFIKGMFFSAVLLLISACGNQADSLTQMNHPGAGSRMLLSSGLTSDDELMLTKVNELRAQLGMQPLVIDPSLQKAAALHSDYMDSNDTLTHSEPPPNEASWDRVANQGGSFKSSGENIACGNQSAEATFLQWQNSPGHYSNMVNPNYQFIGIARSGVQKDYATSNCSFYWTTDFGG